MNDLKTNTSPQKQRYIESLKETFPSCVKEAISKRTGEKEFLIDFDQLKQELSDHIVEGPQERFQLDWPGKKGALFAANAKLHKTLRPSISESVNFECTQNLFIEGDNFESLKIIEETFLGSVNMIYIDPPYNTGRNLIYKNDFSIPSADFLAASGQVGEGRGKLVSNLETSGRFHSDWLSMMYQRLRVAKNILAKEGVLVCAIDENEFGTLSILLKEIFTPTSWEHAYITVVHNPRGQQGLNFSYVNEYLIFVYPIGTKSIGNRKIRDEDVRWSQFRNWGGESERKDAKNCFYPVIVQNDEVLGFGDVCPDDFHPKQTEWVNGIAHVYPIDNSGIERKWRYARQSVDEISSMLKAKRSGSGYQIEIGKTFGLYRSVWTDKRYDSNEYGSKLVNTLIEGSGFTFPKSLWAVYDPIEAITATNKNAVVLDFFAGSATTAHAVMKLNANDGGNRTFVMMQVPEPISPSLLPYKRGFTTIAEISKERIRRAGKQVLEGDCHPDWNKDVGFRVLKIDSSNMADTYYRPEETKQGDLLKQVNTIKPGRNNPEDLLFQVMLDWAVDLTLPITRKTLHGKQVFFVNEDPTDLMACFDDGITEDLIKDLASYEPLRMVFKDAGFASDDARINAVQIFKQVSPTTTVKTL